MRIYILLISIFTMGQLYAQSPTAYYNFDCNLQDQQGNYEDISDSGTSICECGVEEDAMTTSDFVLDTSLTEIMGEDFGISFYFQKNSGLNSAELLTIGNNCSSDSTLRIYYLSNINEVVIDLSESVLETTSLNGFVDQNKCWHHVVFTRTMNTYQLYLDGELVDEVTNSFEVLLREDQPFVIGDGPCVGIISNSFEGFIDELTFFDFHVQPFLVEDITIPNDIILNRDTTIYEGGTINLSAVENCSGIINWSPDIGLADVDQFQTTLTGIETTTYIATFTNVGCISKDTVTVYVVNEDEIDCGELLLPNVFTPNGDGLNDNIGILNHFIIEEFNYFEIYNRWGERVFQTTDKLGRWDGFFQAKAVNSGEFLYKISYSCRGNEVVTTGVLTVMR